MSNELSLSAPTTDAMRDLGERIGKQLKAGDVVVLTGPLGAGKTTLTQGIARGLGVTGSVTSPTFVISRIHNDAAGTAVLVHVDAYRLSDIRDLETLDLDDYLPTAAVVIEWGQRIFDITDPRYLVISIERDDDAGDPAADDTGARTITMSAALASALA